MKIIVEEKQQNAHSVAIVCSGPSLNPADAIKSLCRFIPTQTIGQQSREVSIWPVCEECFRARLVTIANSGATPIVGSLCELLEYFRTKRATGGAA